MWDVLPSERYFPAYYAGLAAELTTAANPSALLESGHGALPRGSEEIEALARYLQTVLPLNFNQAGWLLGEIRYCSEQRLAFATFSNWQNQSFGVARVSDLAQQVIQALHGRHASNEFRGWRVGSDPTSSSRKHNATYLRADGQYRWAPEAFAHLDLAWAALQLDCEIRADGEVSVRFIANDQFGWLFPQAERLVERAIISAFAACRGPRSPSRTHVAPPRPPRPMEFLAPTYAPRTPADKLEWVAGFTLVRHCKTLLEADRLQDAFDWSGRASARLPEASFCASVCGLVHLLAGSPSSALPYFDRATQLDWRNCSACSGRASAHSLLGKPNQAALAECNAAIGQGSADEWLYEVSGSICHEIGNFDRAESDYKVARDLHAPAIRPSLERRIKLAVAERTTEFPRFDTKQWVLPLLLAWRRHVNV